MLSEQTGHSSAVRKHLLERKESGSKKTKGKEERKEKEEKKKCQKQGERKETEQSKKLKKNEISLFWAPNPETISTFGFFPFSTKN